MSDLIRMTNIFFMFLSNNNLIIVNQSMFIQHTNNNNIHTFVNMNTERAGNYLYKFPPK